MAKAATTILPWALLKTSSNASMTSRSEPENPRRNFAGVVYAVGHQYDNFALGFQVTQSVDRCGKAGTNRGTVFNGPKLQTVDVHLKEIVVKRERRGDVRLARKRHQADAISGAFLHKFLEDILRNHQPVYTLAVQFKVLGFHASAPWIDPVPSVRVA